MLQPNKRIKLFQANNQINEELPPELLSLLSSRQNFDAYKIIQYRSKNHLSQADLARKLHLKQQVVSRIEAALYDFDDQKAELARSASATVKYALLKYCNYDLEEDKEVICFSDSIDTNNAIAIPFYTDEHCKHLANQYMFFDKRWLVNILGLEPKNLLMFTEPHGRARNEKNPAKNIEGNDLLLIDTSKTKPTGIERAYAVLFNNDSMVFRIKSDWNGIKLISTSNGRSEEDPPKNFKIIGEVVWNASHVVL